MRLGVDRLVVVGDGEAVQQMRDSALEAGGSAVLLPDADAAVEVLRTELRPGDVVLVKASRSVGLERVAAALLEAAPDDVVAATATDSGADAGDQDEVRA